MKSVPLKIVMFATALTIFLMCCVGICACNTQPKEVDVVLFTGQSNMVGRETQIYETDIPSGRAYEYSYLEDKLREVYNPVGETFGDGAAELERSSGSSIVPEFCAEYVEKTGRNIVAVHVARGGRAISYFEKDKPMYESIVTKYKACIDYLQSSKKFTIGRCFYIMFQGESDTGSTSKEEYKQSFMSFHDGVKEELGIDFGALLQTGLDVKTISDGKVELTSEADVARIAKAKTELAEDNDDIIIINTEAMNYHNERKDYMLADIYSLVHYNAAGLRQIAKDSCGALLNYLGYGDQSLKGVDPVTYL